MDNEPGAGRLASSGSIMASPLPFCVSAKVVGAALPLLGAGVPEAEGGAGEGSDDSLSPGRFRGNGILDEVRVVVLNKACDM